MQESCDESDDDNDCEQNIKDFIEIVNCPNERVREKQNDPSFKRAFKSFKCNLKKTIQNEITLTRVMFQYARDNSQNINVGRKRKHGSRISVQSTAIARRTHRAVGRSNASYGRKEHVCTGK